MRTVEGEGADMRMMLKIQFIGGRNGFACFGTCKYFNAIRAT